MPPKKNSGPAVLPPPRRGKSLYPTYKVLLVGDAAVGKSNLMTRFANDCFDLHSKSTIGVDFVTREMDIGGTAEDIDLKDPNAATSLSTSSTSSRGSSPPPPNSNKVNLQIWDTAGQERCGMVSSAFYRGARGVVVCYDVTRKQTLLNVPRWMAHAKKYAGADCIFMVVGNKMDLENLKETTEEEAEEISHILGIRHYYASALTGETVPQVFFQLALAVHSTALVSAGEVPGANSTTQPNSDALGTTSDQGPRVGGQPEGNIGPKNPKPDFSGGGSSNSALGGQAQYNGMDPYKIQLNRPAQGRSNSDGKRGDKKGCPCN